VLNNKPYTETDSTAGRHVWTLDSREVPVGANVTQTRETLLWDLAGQPGYRVIHQLHLNEVAVALVCSTRAARSIRWLASDIGSEPCGWRSNGRALAAYR
jgi:GTPase SAR1 family protein